MNALADPRVGSFVNENFVSSFQKVGTFRVTETPNGGPKKQGGNVAAYFCAPDGRVLHAVAGPVAADAFLKEARWVVDTVRRLMAETKGNGAAFKQGLRAAHADKLQRETGLRVEPTTFDPPETMADGDALTYRDPSGRPLAPALPPPPIDGPDVRLSDAEFNSRQAATTAGAGAKLVACRASGRRVAVNNQAVVHQLLAAHGLARIERVYGTVFENVLGEKVSTRPVDVVSPFSWVDRAGNRAGR